MTKNRRNFKTFIVLFFLLTLLFSTNSVSFADKIDWDINYSVEENEVERPNILISVLAWAMKYLAILLYNLLTKAQISLDNLVYNGGGVFSGLTLFKPGNGQDFLATFYNLLHYIALGMFVSIMLWGVKSISEAGDSPQALSQMKDKLNRIVFTLVLLYIMPELLTLLVKFSNGFVVIFKSVGSHFGGGEGGAFISNYINANLLVDDYDIVDAITSLILVGINLWLIFFYVLRDLAVSFLFMLFPVMAIFFPFSKDMLKNWVVVMLGNILSQPIQAFVLTVVTTLGNSIPDVVGNGASAFATGIYTIVAFASIVPMTGIIKSLLRIESGIGAANSRAGLGGIMGAFMLAKGMKDSLGKNVSRIGEGLGEKMSTRTARTQVEKNLSLESTGSTREALGRPLINPKSETLGNFNVDTPMGKEAVLRNLDIQNRRANKKIIAGIGSAGLGIAGGVIGGVAGASIGAGVGGGQGARTFGMIGGGLGGSLGAGAGLIGGEVYDLGHGAYDNIQMEKDIKSIQVEEMASILSKNEGMKPEKALELAPQYINPLNDNYDKNLAEQTRVVAENKYLGIQHEKLDGTVWQDQERKALMRKQRLERISSSNAMSRFANMSYAELTPANKEPQELLTINDANIYQDKDKSIVYRNMEGEMPEILAVGKGNPYLSEPISNPISFNSSDISSMPNDILYKNQIEATELANSYMSTAHPNLSPTSAEYITYRNEKINEYKREMRHIYEDNLKSIQSSLNIPNLSIRTNEDKLSEMVAHEKVKQERKLELLRDDMKKKTLVEHRKSTVMRSVYTDVEGLF